jgi:WD40 repeat protein
VRFGLASTSKLAAAVLALVAIVAPAAAQDQPFPPVVTGSADQTIRLWDDKGKQAQNVLADSTVNCITLSSDGRMVIAGGEDKTVRIYTADNLSVENTFDAHDKAVLCLSLSPNGRVLATGGADHKVKLWNPVTGKLLYTIPAHNGPVRALAWSPDGRLLASGGADRLLQFWRADGSPAGTIVGHDEPVTALAWSKDSRVLISGAADGFLQAWNSADFSVVARQRAHTKAITAVAMSAATQKIATAGTDGRLKIWSFYGSVFTETFAAPPDRVINCLAWSRDGSLLITGGSDKTLRYWRTKDGALLLRVNAHDSPITSLAVAQ